MAKSTCEEHDFELKFELPPEITVPRADGKGNYRADQMRIHKCRNCEVWKILPIGFTFTESVRPGGPKA